MDILIQRQTGACQDGETVRLSASASALRTLCKVLANVFQEQRRSAGDHQVAEVHALYHCAIANHIAFNLADLFQHFTGPLRSFSG